MKVNAPGHVVYQMKANDERNFLRYFNWVTDPITGIRLHFFVKMNAPGHDVYQMKTNDRRISRGMLSLSLI